MKQVTLSTIIALALSTTGCATWKEMSDTEKQAWIFSTAIVGAAAFLSSQEDSIVVNQPNCFESVCKDWPNPRPHPLN